MKKKILSLLIAVVMLLGQGLTAVSTAAPRGTHDRPAKHKWFQFWHRDNAKPAVKHKKQTPKKHKFKKKNSNHKWFKWHKNKPAVKKKQQHNKKKIKLFEKRKKHSVKKQHKQQKFRSNNRNHQRKHYSFRRHSSGRR